MLEFVKKIHFKFTAFFEYAFFRFCQIDWTEMALTLIITTYLPPPTQPNPPPPTRESKKERYKQSQILQASFTDKNYKIEGY